jgi:mannosylglycerate hydrolase
LSITTEVTLHADSRRVDFSVALHNAHLDHRLRALVRAPFVADRFDAEHGLAVLARPFDPAAALGGGAERAAPTGQHHLFVDVGAGELGVALMSRGLLEHEVRREHGETQLLLTLLRSVGWLARGDLEVIDHAAGPMLPTPDAQELGAHRFEYALLLHQGDWRRGAVLDEARRYQAAPLAWHARGPLRAPRDAALVEVTPNAVILSALHPAEGGRGLIARVLNTAAEETTARLVPYGGCHEAGAVDPLGRAVPSPVWRVHDGVAEARLRAWQLATVWLR